MSDPKTARIRELNDAFRRTFSGGNVVMTAGVNALPDMVKAAALTESRDLRRVQRRQRSARRARLRQLRAVRSQVLLENRVLRPCDGARQRRPERSRENHPRHDRHARLGVLTMRRTANGRRIYALADYTVERTSKGWYYRPHVALRRRERHERPLLVRAQRRPHHRARTDQGDRQA